MDHGRSVNPGNAHRSLSQQDSVCRPCRWPAPTVIPHRERGGPEGRGASIDHGLHVIGSLPSFNRFVVTLSSSVSPCVSLVTDRNVRPTQPEASAVSFVDVAFTAQSLISPSSVVFLLHIFLEAPLIVQGFWYPQSLPLLGMNNTTLVLIKV